MDAERTSTNDGERSEQVASTAVMVIFGGAGDLTKRKLVPALYNLASQGLLPKGFAVVGVSRREMTSEEYRERLGRDLQEFGTGPVDSSLWHWLAERIYYQRGDATDPETGQRYTVKRYESQKAEQGDSWHHTRITLKPVNPDFEPIVLTGTDEGELQVIAEVVEVLGDKS